MPKRKRTSTRKRGRNSSGTSKRRRKDDDRFTFAKPQPFASSISSHSQLVNNVEIKKLKPRTQVTNYEFGQQLEYIIGKDDFAVSDINHIEIEGQCQRRAVTSQDEGDWELCEAADVDVMILNDQFDRAMIPYVGVRQGLDHLETSGLLPRMRYLMSNFISAHMSKEAKNLLKYQHNSITDTAYRNSDQWKQHYKTWATPILTKGFKFKISPMAFPFRFDLNPYMEDKMFPNRGQEMNLIVGLEKSDKLLFYTARTLQTGSQTEFKPLDYNYRVKITNVDVSFNYPRLSIEGMSVLKNPSLGPINYPSPYLLQYSQTIAPNLMDKFFTIQDVRLPQYMLLQLYDSKYLLPDQEITDYFTKPVYRPLEMGYQNISFQFGNRALSYFTSNVDVGKEGSDLLRQKILKFSNIFNVPMDMEYFSSTTEEIRSATESPIVNYQPHVLVSFCSNEQTKEIIKPLDSPFETDTKQNLTVSLVANNSAPLTPGRLICTLIYDTGMTYIPSRGVFDDPDVRSLVIAS